MNELRELVRQYVEERIDFGEFRRTMLQRFLRTKSPESGTQDAVVAIEAECADFSEGLIDAKVLMGKLRMIVLISNALTLGAKYDPLAKSGTSSLFIPGAALVLQASLRRLPEAAFA
jgi:hypothetical protein